MDAQQPILISPEEIDLVVENLLAEFGTVFGLGDIERLTAGSLDLLEEVRSGPVLAEEVEQFTRDRLRAQGKVEGTLLAGVPSAIFVCVHNAGRSQMSAGWGAASGRGRIAGFLGRLGTGPGHQSASRRGDARGWHRHLRGISRALHR